MSSLVAPDRGWTAESPLANPAVRLGVLMPPVAALAYGIVTDTIVDLRLFAVLLAVSFVLGLVAVLRPWGPARPRVERAWQVLSGSLGVGLAAPFLVLAIDVDVERFSLLFALVVVVGAYSYPRPLRLPLITWAIAVWMATLWWGGVREVEIVALHLGGGLTLLAACVRTADELADAVEEEATSRADAEARTQLLASILRTNSLEPTAVIRAVVTGMVDAGFDAVAIRAVDEEAGVLRLVDGHRVADTEMVDTLPIEDAHLSREALRRQVTVVVDEYDRSTAVLHQGRGLRGTVVVPVSESRDVVAVVIGASTSGPPTAGQVEAATLLAEQAGRALERARAFEEDQRTVAQLRLLDLRTQDFVSTVSHELRTPLTVIQGLGQTLLRRWGDVDEARRRDLLERIDVNAERLAAMVESLLDTSALDQGELPVAPEPVELRPLVDALTHRLETVTAEHPVDVRVPEGLHVEVDPALLEHVLENLLVNVARHTPAGTRTRVGAEATGDRVRIVVEDEGPGIPEQDLPHVLDRFYRGGPLATRPAGGLGLGLALAQQIVRAHGAELEVDSVVGEGTTFRFEVPAATLSPVAHSGRERRPAS